MKKIYLLLLFAFAVSTVGYGQTVITNQTFTDGSLPTGWTSSSPTQVTFISGANASASFNTNGATLTSPSFTVSSYGQIDVAFQAKKFANGNGSIIAEYSIDGGAYQIGATAILNGNDQAFGSFSFPISNPGTNLMVRFTRSANMNMGLKNLVITGNSCEPATQATNYSTTNINDPAIGNATLNWTRGSGDNVLVVMRQGSPVTSNPTNGTVYTTNTNFGNGSEIGAGNYVVYNGSANTVTVTGLNISTTYHVAIYEYNNAGNCYKTPALIGNFTVPGSITYLFFSNNGTDTWIPEDPNGISTAIDNINVFLGNAVISSNTLINNVTVSSTGALTVNSGTVLQVNGTLTMESDNINYSSLMLEGSIAGAIRYERHVNGGPGVGVGAGANDLISSPLVSSQNFGEFATSNPNIRFDTTPGGDPNTKLFGPFNKATGSYLNWNAVTDATQAIVPGVGYRASSTDNDTFVFRGTVNQGIVTNNITYTTTSGVSFKPWNLVGNPYPAYINVGDFLNYVVDTNTGTRNVDILDIFGAAIYGYDGNASDGWTIWNLNTPEKNIAPGQGFLVAAEQSQVAAYDLTFAPMMRRIDTADDFIPNRSANTNNFHLKLRALIGTGNHHTDFYFNDNSSSGLDKGYDAAVYGNVAPAKSIYSRLVQNSTGNDMAIQSLAIEALGSDIVVPLGIKAAQGQQVTVSIAESNLPSNIEVFLEDNVTNTFTLLNNSDYIFTPSSTLNSTGRFFLRFNDQTLSTPDANFDELQIFTTGSPRTLFVKGQLYEASSITIYDMQGRVVLSSQLETSSNTNQLDVSKLNSGVYVVKLNNSSQQKTQKVILK